MSNTDTTTGSPGARTPPPRDLPREPGGNEPEPEPEPADGTTAGTGTVAATAAATHATRSLRRRPVRDALRLVHVIDVLNQLGTMLYKRSLRYTALTASIALLGYSVNLFGMTGFTARQAVSLPLIVGGVTLLGGLLLKLVPAIIASRQTLIAQASDLNLMEDYRKAQQDTHLRILWDRVYRLEGEAPEEFAQRAGDAILALLPQTRQRYETGLDLHLVEDWYDGAYFDRTDQKLLQQYEGDVGLGQARQLAGLGLLSSLGDLPERLAQRLWFALATRAVAVHVADAVHGLNTRWGTDDFNAQTLLWPGEEDAAWLTRHAGARAEVLRRRGRFLARTFGRRRERTLQMLDRLFGPNYRLAARLRLRFDPEYLLGRLVEPDGAGEPVRLGYSFEEDLAELDWPRPDPLRRFAARFVPRATPRLERFLEALEALDSNRDLPAGGDSPGVRRAALVLFHASDPMGKRSAGAQGKLDVGPWLEQAALQLDRVTHLLVLVRQHHELTRLERLGYLSLIETLRRSAAPG